MLHMSHADLTGMRLARNAHGRLVLTLGSGQVFESVVPVRAFPLAAPEEGLSLVSSDGKEALWVDRMADLPADARALIEEDLAVREFVPTIQSIRKVSSFSTPSTWDLETDRGSAQMVLKAEEDIRKLAGRTRLLISGSDGVQYRIPDTTQLDKHSRKLLERFL
ncbi:DUF1854 domain-containing protein [Comamonas terrigena]|uniref:cyanophycin metabolism-associated DUF1854 family protein n=1 Tax=Comamonas terrigena TaxID=32013 RepID=UPI002448158E|nr:DUF1854 domain-containing protein [Comamonas terrigena]MDH0048022.1 DUF1854 domain-containing protein [Comamonas terrigena]MDH0510378.1 DUF1854 domain-containing protein [Comamonas terrigena]MDH1089980.1 DUF1854 domain-containing protein [Comamonas terrigena]MDH1291882.1 DUF1854 domain-containing protein [Comamonas terrigena]MDH1499852.1 DUF1854 domain-containing protein [Comamonas terrigena]